MIRYDDNFVPKYKRTTKARTPILFFHSWRAGRLVYQGYVFRLNADGSGNAQLFEWFMGEPSDEITFTRAFLEECTFYSTDQEMRAASDAYNYERRRSA